MITNRHQLGKIRSGANVDRRARGDRTAVPDKDIRTELQVTVIVDRDSRRVIDFAVRSDFKTRVAIQEKAASAPYTRRGSNVHPRVCKMPITRSHACRRTSSPSTERVEPHRLRLLVAGRAITDGAHRSLGAARLPTTMAIPWLGAYRSLFNWATRTPPCSVSRAGRERWGAAGHGCARRRSRASRQQRQTSAGYPSIRRAPRALAPARGTRYSARQTSSNALTMPTPIRESSSGCEEATLNE